jgi:hypothetical protein
MHVIFYLKTCIYSWGDYMKAYLWGAVILLLLSACSQDSILEGISQDSSRDSKIEQARIDLDNSNYDQVISDLSTIYTTAALDPNVGQLLASAYMGKAGIDLTIFIANSNSSGLNPFDVVASMISSSNVTVDGEGKYIASTLMPDMLGYITNAEETLQVMAEKDKAAPDDIIQLGIDSATHFIMFLGNATKYENMPINTAAYKATTLSGVGPKNFVVVTTSGGIPSYQQDLININNAVIAFSNAYPKPNEMRDSLNNFLYSALGTTSGVSVTDELIMKLTTAGLNDYVHSFAN